MGLEKRRGGRGHGQQPGASEQGRAETNLSPCITRHPLVLHRLPLLVAGIMKASIGGRVSTSRTRKREEEREGRGGGGRHAGLRKQSF